MLPSVAVGTMNFGKRTAEPEAKLIVKRALERGLTWFDTANVYENGESEKILGRALREVPPAERAKVIVASKVGLGRVGRNAEGLARATVLAACDASLARLGTDALDLYYLHAPDRATPIEETLGALKELLAAGKIRAWGISNYASWEVLEMNLAADQLGMARPVIAQQIYNMLVRQLEIEWFKFTAKHPIHTTVYNALAGGLLAREHVQESIPAGSRFDKNTMYQRRYWSDAMFAFTKSLRAIADDEKLSLASLAYAWLKGRPGVGSVLVGPASVAQLDAACDGLATTLSAEANRRIDEAHQAFTGTDASYAR
ncbi:MAG: L-fuco-beta-pyranose dehydrogenase [Myxococcaceae bacterium]|nr:L-fuco-beta-pyranose dehydrogenase [Myxococcaceae bacterium]